MSSMLFQLEQEDLPASAMSYVKKLPASEQEGFASLLVESIKQKDKEVEQALDQALEVVPAPLRRAVRKILFS